MDRNEQISFAVESLLYSRPLEFGTLGGLLDEVLRSGVREVRVKLLISEPSLASVFLSATSTIRGTIVPTFVTETAIAGRVSGRFGRAPVQTVDGQFAAVRHPTVPLVWLVITDATTDFLARPFRYFLRASHPRPTAPILRTPQLQALVDNLVERVHVSDGATRQPVRITQLGYRSRISSEGAEKVVERDRKWTDLSVEEAFSEALNEGQWVTDVGVQYPDPYYPARRGRARIGRYSVFTFTRSATPAFDAFITPAAEMAQQWYGFLKDRARRAANRFTTHPFRIDFGYPVLSSREQIELLGKVLRGMPSVTCTVLHGNPYFHAVMLDYRDGSTYEILVSDDQGLNIIPQGRSTVKALQRVCSKVFADFREGELIDAGQPDPAGGTPRV